MRTLLIVAFLAGFLGCAETQQKDPDLDPFQENLANQLEMNKKTFAKLVANGLTPETEVRLEFYYVAESELSATELSGLLSSETDYEVAVVPPNESESTWLVTGNTNPTVLSLEILDQWVDWMVTAGKEHNCQFDGWGTEI